MPQNTAAFLLLIFLTLCITPLAFAQNASLLTGKMTAIDARTLKYDGKIIELWGTEYPVYKDTLAKQHARYDLDNLTAISDINCIPRAKTEETLIAQCYNKNKQDLAIWMIEQGNLLVNRAQAVGTKFEGAYLKAEQTARAGKAGTWAQEIKQDDDQAKILAQLTLILSLNTLFFIGLAVIAGVTTLLIYRKTHNLQNNIEQVEGRLKKQTSIHEKERKLVAVMMHSELRNNHSKIEAFIVIYDDMLKNIKETHSHHTTLQAGEVVREAPAMDRFIFDGNADKMDILGQRLAEHVIAFYAHVNTEPDYKSFDAGMDTVEALKAIESIINNAKNLKKNVEEILEEFEKIGIQSASLIFADEG